MKLDTKQENAKTWSKALSKINDAQAGQVQVTYENEQGQKCSGYIDLFDLQIVVNEKTVSFGSLLTNMLNFNMETLKQVQTLAKGVASNATDLLVVKTDELGFIAEINNFNSANNVVVANQPIPSDYLKGYYYLKDGLITISETRKLDLFPDYV